MFEIPVGKILRCTYVRVKRINYKNIIKNIEKIKTNIFFYLVVLKISIKPSNDFLALAFFRCFKYKFFLNPFNSKVNEIWGKGSLSNI